MGVIDLVCVTTDPGATTYYGLAYADDYGQGSKKINYAVLIKSNTRPISPGDLTWSVVSMFESSKLAGDPYSVAAADCSCVINEQGVFTMFGLSAGALSTTASTLPFGIRYDPTSGVWMNVTVNAGYTWSGVFSRRSLGYVNNDWFYVNITSMDYFVPIGNYTGSSTIGLFKKEDTMYTFGNDSGSWYTHLVDDINITNSLGIDPNPPPPALPSSPLLSTGAIVGIVVGVVVVLAGAVFLLLRMIRKSKNKVNITTAALVKDDSATAEDGDKNASFRKSGDSGEPNYLYLDGKHPYWRPSSTESLPLASMTPVPEHLQERLRVLQEQMRAVQAQIRVTTQFSSHPRPNVVTTLSKQGEPTASGVSESSSASGSTTATTTRKGSLESIPYVPLSSLPESTYLGYSSAPAYSNVIAQPSSQDSPEVAPQEFVESSETVASLPVPSSSVDSRFHSMQS
ncbi:hypothetical protein BGZ88_001726 [Linnemannia elongata]|nr:hypothetical protein BGZ88_001726 [Linnemannia elongata]